MEELGFFERIEGKLPEHFTAVYEIARVLDNPAHVLTRRLSPALKLGHPGRRAAERPPEPEQAAVPVLAGEDEYEAGTIRSPRDIPRMYLSQWLFPQEVLYRKLAKKELLVPYPKAPCVYPVEPDRRGYDPDARKQKLYILLDTSSSMAVKNRIHVAKAVCYHMLVRNMRELGFITMRTFDVSVGERHEACDRQGFQDLLRLLARVRTLGDGTAMARAVMQAVEDIARVPSLASAEILIITDGACVLDEERIRALMERHKVVIHTVKIGRIRLYPPRSVLHDMLFASGGKGSRVIADMQAKERELRRLRDAAHSPQRRRLYEESLASVRREIEKAIRIRTDEIVSGYGRELERLSRVYVEIDDMDMAELLPDREESGRELRRLLESVRGEMEDPVSSTAVRKLALLCAHAEFLSSVFEEKRGDGMFTRIAQETHEYLLPFLGGKHGAGAYGSEILFGDDMRDVRWILSVPGLRRTSLWRLLEYVIRSALRSFRNMKPASSMARKGSARRCGSRFVEGYSSSKNSERVR
ncbi:MAG: VWA domain-containing protein [Bacteroidota bacterium]|nr:VWA domain-containing protein [Bacteroidota bacterium]